MKPKKIQSNVLEYKGYNGSIEVSIEDNCLYGKLIGLQNGSISYEGKTIEELTTDFHFAVDDYLEHCAAKQIKPEKPFSGSFNVRVSPEIHKCAVLKAKELGTTLNGYIKEIIKNAVLN